MLVPVPTGLGVRDGSTGAQTQGGPAKSLFCGAVTLEA